MSNRPVNRRKWRVALVVLAMICLSGTLLTVVLALGAANPVRLDLSRLRSYGIDIISDDPHVPDPPFSIFLGAINHGGPRTWWGLWIGGTDQHDSKVFAIDNQGYMSVAFGDKRDWQQFIHLTNQRNTLSLLVQPGGEAKFHINGELAWEGHLALPRNALWGVAKGIGADLEWPIRGSAIAIGP